MGCNSTSMRFTTFQQQDVQLLNCIHEGQDCKIVGVACRVYVHVSGPGHNSLSKLMAGLKIYKKGHLECKQRKD